MFKNVHIKGVGSYHPDKKLENDYFINHFKEFQLEDHAKALMNKLGRKTRTLADENDTGITMAVEAAKNALKNSGLSSDDIDMIISVSDTPEYLSPCCALLIKNQLKANNAHAIFDMNANCVGMLTAMDTATRYLKTDDKYNRVLVVGSLLISPHARLDDMITYGCTGDGAAAIILEKKEESMERGLLGSRMYTDDEYYWSITMPSCGISNIGNDELESDHKKMLWKPFDFGFLSDKWSELIRNLLSDFNHLQNDVSHYFMSQFSKADVELTMANLGATMDDSTFIGDQYGYTGCTSPIMALEEKLKSDQFQKDDLVVFCSVASGYSMTALLYKW